MVGADVARIIGEHFANPRVAPRDLANAFHDVYVPIHHNTHISAVVMEIDPVRARRTGRWLVRHSTDRCSALIGLAILAAVGKAEDTPIIQTIGLLSDKFCPLAARALERLSGGTEALLWLADRVEGWGRVYVVEALCRLADPAAKPWLLRRAVDGDFLNGYFAGKVAKITAMHEAIADLTADDDLVDHAGRLLQVLTQSRGMGTSIEDYPYAARVFDIHVQRLDTQQPTARRFATAAMLAGYLHGDAATHLDCSLEQLNQLRDGYLSVLDRDDWCEVIRRAVAGGDEQLHPVYLRWLVTTLAPRLGLRTFTGVQPAGEDEE